MVQGMRSAAMNFARSLGKLMLAFRFPEWGGNKIKTSLSKQNILRESDCKGADVRRIYVITK